MLAVRSGEVLKTKIVMDEKIIAECIQMVEEFKPCGPITVQLIRDKNTDEDYFIEINPMPTVWINNAFSHSFSEIDKAKSFAAYLSELKQIIPEITLHNFLLSIAILAFITTM